MTRTGCLVTAAALVAALTAGRATAADLGAFYKAPSLAPAFSWSGFFVGGHWGEAWGDTKWSESENSSATGGFLPPGFTDASFTERNWLAGGQFGFNNQIGTFVWGVAVDADSTSLTGSSNCFLAVPGTVQTCNTKFDALGTVVLRAGLAFDRAMLYGLVGWAWANERNTNFCNTCGIGGAASLATVSQVINGYTVGGGIEYALFPAWSVFGQYNYMGFGTWNANFSDGNISNLPIFTENTRQNLSVVKVGINYMFGQPGH